MLPKLCIAIISFFPSCHHSYCCFSVLQVLNIIPFSYADKFLVYMLSETNNWPLTYIIYSIYRNWSLLIRHKCATQVQYYEITPRHLWENTRIWVSKNYGKERYEKL